MVMNRGVDFSPIGLTPVHLKAVVKKLGGSEGVMRFLQSGIVAAEPKRLWREKGGVIRFSVTSDGTTGNEWIDRLEKKGYQVGDYAKSVLLSKDFKPTSGVTTEVVVFKGMMFEDSNRITQKIREFATERGLVAPNAEVACIIRELFPDDEIEAMGLYWIVAMHEPIKDFGGNSRLLGARRVGEGCQFGACYDGPGSAWLCGDGVAFAMR